METYAIIAVIVGLVGFIAWLKFFRKRTMHTIIDEFVMLGISAHLADFKHSYTTSRGARVQSTVPVPMEVLPLIDEGILNQIVRHTRQYPHWDKYTQVSDYDVLLIDPMGTNQETEPGSPCIFVNGWQTAGTCLGVYPRSTIKPYIVAPHQQAQDWRFRDYFMRTIWHESEHIREHQNDIGIFYYWATTGDVHPHVGGTGSLRGADPEPAKCLKGLK